MSSGMSERWSRYGLTILVAVALVKIAAFLYLATSGRTRPFVGANAVHHYLPAAERLLYEGRFNGPDSRPDSKVPPGYPLFLAMVMRVAPREGALLIVVCLQMLADLVTGLLIYGLARRFCSPQAAVAAGLFWQLYPPAFILSTWITAETLFTTLFTLSIALLVHGIAQGRRSWIPAAGIVLGLATLTRATPLFLPLLLLALPWAGKLRFRAAFAAAAYATIVPWTIRNVIVLQDPIVVSVGFGSVLLQGSDGRFFSGEGKRTWYKHIYAEAAQAGIRRPPTDRESAIDRWMGRVGLYVYEKRLKERPLSFVPFMAGKLLRLWYGTETRGWLREAFLGLCSLLVVPLGLWQWYSWRLRARDASLIVLGCAGYFVLLHWITLPQIRYMLPLYPLLMVGATAAYADLLRAARLRYLPGAGALDRTTSGGREG